MTKIPAKWQKYSYQEVFNHYSTRGFQIPTSEVVSSGILPVVDQGKEYIIGFTNDLSRRLSVPDSGIIVFGDHTRTVKYITFDFAIGADGTQLLSGKNNFDTQFLFYCLQNLNIPNLGYARHFKYVKEAEYRIPSLPIQHRIAETLESVDKLIDNLTRRIEKKRRLKQGVMQELLTGKKRLPGFEEEWEGKPLSQSLDSVKASNVPVKWKILQTSQKGLFPAFSASGQDVWTDSPMFHEDGLVISAVGSHCGKAFLARGNWGVVANTHVLLAKNGSYIPFWFYILNDEKWWLKGGSGQPYVMVRQSLARTILTPKPAEQRAIATVLLDIDAAIAKLEAKRAKYEDIKRGLMHDLLTGKVRI